MFSGRTLSAFRGGAATLVLCLVLALLPVRASLAQQSDQSPLGALLQGLNQMQREGRLSDTFDPSGTQPLDRSRTNAAEQGERTRSAFGASSTLLPRERLFFDAYCRGVLRSEDERQIEILTKVSRLERDYCRRANAPLLQFGYELFDGPVDPRLLTSGRVADDYRLGIGDELVISLVGQRSTTRTVRIDREGKVSLPDLPPISAAGMTMAAFERELNARARTAYIGTEAFASLGAVRQINVVVAGEVTRPGAKALTSLSSLIDALALAGGVKKTGSLRRVQIQRGGSAVTVDLYDILLARPSSRSLSIMDGDIIVVPTLGNTIAVGGEVKRPGIYELAPGETRLSFTEALNLTGGALRPAGLRYTRISFGAGGRQQVEEMPGLSFPISAGDLVLVGLADNAQAGSVELLGHVRLPGSRSLATTSSVRALLGDPSGLRDHPYLLFGVLDTIDPATRARRYFPINLQSILDDAEDFTLREGDRLIVLSNEDVAYLSSQEVQDLLRRRSPLAAPNESEELRNVAQRAQNRQEEAPDRSATQLASPTLLTLGRIGQELETANQQQIPTLLPEQTRPPATSPPADANASVQRPRICKSLDVLARILEDSRDGRFSNAVISFNERRNVRLVPLQECREIYETNPTLLPFVLEYAIVMSGEIRRPGAYPVVANTPITMIAAAAGGAGRQVDWSNIELSRQDVTTGRGATLVRTSIDLRSRQGQESLIGPGDAVRFTPLFTDRDTGPVLLVGEFVRPGAYDIRRGEQLSDVIARAGGLTAQAYPYGAVFTRERVRAAEREALGRVARELTAAVTLAAANNRTGNSAGLSALTELSREISSAPTTGRVVIEADPTVLQVRPQLDVVLEPGDRIFMPKRPNSVLVTGDVLNPGAMQFVPGTRVSSYIRQAGGFQRSADESRVFIVFPNGAAQPVGVSAFNVSPVQVPPGSTIVVPKDATPFDLFTFTRELTGVISQLAITAASLSVISNN